MKMTLLEMVQNILSAMDAEEVSSITDTVESMQVAEEIKNAYYENFGNFELKSRLELTYLEEQTLETLEEFRYRYPNVLRIPDNVDTIKWIKYNTNTFEEPVWTDVTYITPEEFIEKVMLNESGDNTVVVNHPKAGLVLGPQYYIVGNKNPEYWTTFDNEYVVFDSIISDLVTVTVGEDVTSIINNGALVGLQAMIYAEQIPTWTESDSFTPDLEDKFFPMLLAEAKSASFINYKGVSNSKEEQRSRRQLVRHQNNRSRYNQRKSSTYNYGRS